MLSPESIRFLLPCLVALPLVAALLLLSMGKAAHRARRFALGAAVLHLLLTFLVVESARKPLAERSAVSEGALPSERDRVFVPEFVPGDPGIDKKDAQGKIARVDSHTTTWELAPFSKNNPKIKGVQFFIGLDGLNIWLIALTSLMLIPAILISWESIQQAAATYYAWLFALQACIMGVFLAFDIILFYVCFELTLIPLFFLISAWGTGPNRREAARKFFLFTLAGGLITLLGIIAVVLLVFDATKDELTFSIPRLAELIQQQLHVNDETTRNHWKDKQIYIFLAIATGFAVKIPLVPLHSWLPGAYSEAPIGVTVLLSALLAKMGTFGLLRICLPLAPDGTLAAGLPLLGTLGAIGIVYGALCAYAQADFKKLVAYSSVSHLGFCALALVAFNTEGMAGGLLHMVNHGLSTGALFLLVGFLLQRYSSGQIADYSGLWKKLPVLTFFMMVICLASIGLPGLNNFVSEMLMLSGLFDLRNSKATGLTLAIAAAFGVFLSAWYMLTMIQRMFFNELREPPALQPGEVRDLNGRELTIIAPLAALCLLIGCCPQVLLDPMKRDVYTLARVADDARREHAPIMVVAPVTAPKSVEELRKNVGLIGRKKDALEKLPAPRPADIPK